MNIKVQFYIYFIFTLVCFNILESCDNGDYYEAIHSIENSGNESFLILCYDSGKVAQSKEIQSNEIWIQSRTYANGFIESPDFSYANPYSFDSIEITNVAQTKSYIKYYYRSRMERNPAHNIYDEDDHDLIVQEPANRKEYGYFEYRFVISNADLTSDN